MNVKIIGTTAAVFIAGLVYFVPQNAHATKSFCDVQYSACVAGEKHAAELSGREPDYTHCEEQYAQCVPSPGPSDPVPSDPWCPSNLCGIH